jgi:hypothetical protein
MRGSLFDSFQEILKNFKQPRARGDRWFGRLCTNNYRESANVNDCGIADAQAWRKWHLWVIIQGLEGKRSVA